MADVFISYKREEREAVELIATRLLELGLSVWFDAGLTAGETFSDEIDREARNAKAILVCWSPAARHSRWVKAEAMIGFDHDKLAACYLAGPDSFSPSTPFNTVHAEDLRRWIVAPTDTHAGWRSVLRRIGKLCARADIESWASWPKEPSIAELRAWIAKHDGSPIFARIDAVLRARVAEEAERERLERRAQELRDREEAERQRREKLRKEAEERERLAREAHELREKEVAERKAEEAEEALRQAEERDLEAERVRVAEARRRRERFTRPLFWVLTCAAAVVIISYLTVEFPRLLQQEAAARSVALHDAAARQAEHLAFTDVYLRHDTKEMRVANSETLAEVLTRAGVSPSDASAALVSIAGVYNLSRIRPGQAISLYFQRDGAEALLTGVAFRSEPSTSITANRTSSGGFEAREVQMPLTFEIARIAAQVEANLYSSALALGATDREVAALADAFSYDVDFQRDVRPGDDFELVFERFYDDEGNTVRTGDLLYVSLESNGVRRELYQFMAPGDARPDWYDADGRSARRFLMRVPTSAARLTSRHSIAHPGIELDAPAGTAVMAAGDGVVERAAPFGSFGNYVRIRHANGYETAYAHMSGFASGVSPGARVRGGQVIGYVGTSGESTRPHLRYQVFQRDQPVDPMSLRVASARSLTGRALELFMIERARINTLRQVRARENPTQETVTPRR